MYKTSKHLLGLVMFGLCACIPLSSENPLGNLKSDPALVGSWASEEFRMDIKRKGRGKITIALTSLEGDDAARGSLQYSVLTSQIAGHGFMSIKQIWNSKSIKVFAGEAGISVKEARGLLKKRDKRLDGWYFAYYDIGSYMGRDILEIFLLDEDNPIIEAALEDKTLEGSRLSVLDPKNDNADHTSEILFLTSSTKTLTNFMADHIDKRYELFEFEIGDLQRL
jgi:hypothetical protein